VSIDIDEDPEDFGDADPEDAWDDIDPFRVRLAVLERILDSIREHRDDRFKLRLGMAVGLVAAMIQEHREDQARLERIGDALEELGGD
jgi:hypothetical protein